VSSFRVRPIKKEKKWRDTKRNEGFPRRPGAKSLKTVTDEGDNALLLYHIVVYIITMLLNNIIQYHNNVTSYYAREKR